MEEFVKSDIDTNKLTILNIMRMSIKAITLSDICDANGWNFTSRAWLLQGSNGLREDYEWPRNPPNFTNNQKKLWQKSLKSVFGRIYDQDSSKRIDYNLQPRGWINEESKNKWKCWYSVTENRLYMKEENRWRAYRSRQSTRFRRFERTEFIYNELHPSASRSATYNHTPNPNIISLESSLSWNQTEPIINPIDHDPYKGPFAQLQYAFDESIACKRILIDEVKIPNDNCTAIVDSIRSGKACIITDGSFFPEHDSGSSAFIITAGKTKKE